MRNSGALLIAFLGGLSMAQGKAPARPTAKAPKAQPKQGNLKEADRLYDQAVAAFNRNQFEEAVAFGEKSYQLAPRTEVLYSLAGAYRNANQMRKAVDAYERFLREAPADDALRPKVQARLAEVRPQALEELGKEMEKAGKHGEAAAAFGEAHKLRPSMRTRYRQATALRQAGSRVEAIRAYEAVAGSAELKPEEREDVELQLSTLRSQVEEQRGQEHLAAGQHEAAAKALGLAYRNQPRAELLLPLAAAQRQAGQLEAAQGSLQRYLADPKAQRRPEAEAQRVEVAALLLSQRGAALVAAGKAEQAVAVYREARRLKALPELLLLEGRAQRAARQREDALGSYERYLKEEPRPTAERRQEVELSRVELRELLAAQRELAEARKPPPVYKRGWFLGLMGVLAAGAGAGLAAGLILGLPKEQTSDLGPPVMLNF